MGRQDTIVFGSQLGTTSTPPSRTGTFVEQRRAAGEAPPKAHPHGLASAGSDGRWASAQQAPLPPVSAPPRYGSDPGPLSTRAPASGRLESQWFAPTNPKLAPIGPEIFEERRGWQPPSPSRGLLFAAISVLLVGIAAAGTFFLLGPDANRSHATPPVSTTTITNAEVPAAPDPVPAAETGAVPTVTPADLPSAPPIVNAVKQAEPPGWHGTSNDTSSTNGANAGAASTATVASPAPAARVQPKVMAPAKPAPLKPAPATADRRETSLPDLDRAASAAGLGAQQDDPFATPGTDTPPAPATATTGSESEASPPTGTTAQPQVEEPSTEPSPPAPSEVLPELQIKR